MENPAALFSVLRMTHTLNYDIIFSKGRMTMDQFIAKEKLSKKARRELERSKRNTWGMLSPVTRKAESKKVYNRKRVRLERNDSYHAEPFIFMSSLFIQL